MAEEQEYYGGEQTEENGQNYQQEQYTGQEETNEYSGAGDQQTTGTEVAQSSGAGGVDDDDDDRKLFVGGLSYETTDTELRNYFAKFGEISDCTLKTDQITGRPRGFGFVVFKETSSVDKVLEAGQHKLRGRNIDPKKANPKRREPNLKVFVGGLNPETSEEQIRSYFEKFGTIAEIDLPVDTEKKRRGFCFIKFEGEDVVRKVVEQRMQTIGGKEVEVKKSVPKRGGFGGGGWGGGFNGGRGGGRGRGRGGYGGGWNQGGYNNQGYGGYGNYNQGGYGNYNQAGYGNYGGYDYNQANYGYNQGYGAGGWGGYDQNYGYDYSGWGGYGQDQSQSGYGKAPKRGGGHGYQPY